MNAMPLFSSEPRYDAARFPEPRPFQALAHEKLRDGIRDGHKNQLLVAPTGAGKTYLALRVAHEALQRGKRVVFVCDRTALINQTSETADSYGLTAHGVVQAEHWRRDVSQLLQIASIQTIAARKYWPDADVIIVDEAHTQHSTWVEKVQNTRAAVVGLTATPCSKGLGLSFTNMVNAATMDELTKSGVLVPLRVLVCTRPDLTDAKTSGGEWTAKSAGECEAKIIGDVVAEWVKHGEGRKTIAFGADIAYCKLLAQRFNEAGITAEVFTSETTASEREVILREYRKVDSRIRVLVSVEALAKGFDVKDVGCVIDARPLRKSLSTAIQMWGRGLRSSPDTGKENCILLDHSGNFLRFQSDFEDVYFNGFKSLDMSEKLDQTVREEPEDFVPKGCPSCGHKPFNRRCLSCGFEKVPTVLEDASVGVMKEVRIGKSVLAPDRQNLWQQICGYTRGSGNPDTASQRAWYLFRDITGERAPRSWLFERTEAAPISRATLNKIKSLRIAYIKGKQAQEARA